MYEEPHAITVDIASINHSYIIIIFAAISVRFSSDACERVYEL